MKALASGLIDLTAGLKSGFSIASTLEKSGEELLIDGAIDQTFSFGRQSFIPLTAAKIELMDKLAEDVPEPTVYLMNSL